MILQILFAIGSAWAVAAVIYEAMSLIREIKQRDNEHYTQ